ncbi:hypothetical protein DBP18_07680 [Streptomyces sp. CS081A]|nr:hypothetical protein DBP18_07680 [Streptomyces sp. CS081A]
MALGEPYGAAGARLTATAPATLRHDDLNTVLISLVAADDQGMALPMERASWKGPTSGGRLSVPHPAEGLPPTGESPLVHTAWRHRVRSRHQRPSPA